MFGERPRFVYSGEVEDDEEVWFEPEVLARASTVELVPAGDGILRPAFDPDAIGGDALDHVHASLAHLIGPAAMGSEGYGLGESFDRLAGGLRAGRTWWWRSGARSDATRHLLHQLAEGLALRGAVQDRVHVPVVVLCSQSRREVQSWALARWTGFPAQIFQLGASAAHEIGGHAPHVVTQALSDAKAALEGPLAQGRDRLRHVDASVGMTGIELAAHVTDAISAWRGSLVAASPGECMPVVIIEDLERWVPRRSTAEERRTELEAAWSAWVARAHAHGWALIVHAGAGPGSDAATPAARLRIEDELREMDADRWALSLAREDVVGGPAQSARIGLCWSPATGRVAATLGPDPG